jgi:hypothetical protein
VPTVLAHELAQLDEVLYRSVVGCERVLLVASVVKFFVDDQHTSEQQFVRDFLHRVVPAHCRDGILDHTYRSDVAGVRQPKLFAPFANPVNVEVSYITHGSSLLLMPEISAEQFKLARPTNLPAFNAQA